MGDGTEMSKQEGEEKVGRRGENREEGVSREKRKQGEEKVGRRESRKDKKKGFREGGRGMEEGYGCDKGI